MCHKQQRYETFEKAAHSLYVFRTIVTRSVTYLPETNYTLLIKRSNLMQQCADIYVLQSDSICFGCHSTHHQEH